MNTERGWNKEAFNASHWDIRIFDECFKNKAALTDVDACIERNGHFLIIEFKSLKYKNGSPDFAIPNGQYRMFQAFQKLGVFTIFIVWGKVDKPDYVKVLGENEKIIHPQSTDMDHLKSMVSDWELKVY